MPQKLTDDKSTLVPVMAWCRQASSHYLIQCWLSSLSYCVVRAQWVNMNNQIRLRVCSKHWWRSMKLFFILIIGCTCTISSLIAGDPSHINKGFPSPNTRAPQRSTWISVRFRESRCMVFVCLYTYGHILASSIAYKQKDLIVFCDYIKHGYYKPHQEIE